MKQISHEFGSDTHGSQQLYGHNQKRHRYWQDYVTKSREDNSDLTGNEESLVDLEMSESSYALSCKTNSTCSIHHQFWSVKSRLGYVQVELEVFSKRLSSTSYARTTFMTRICSRRRQDLIPSLGFSLSWISAPDQQGFYQIFPSLFTFPIVPNSHGALRAIENGDLGRLQQTMMDGQVHLHLRSQDLLGWDELYCM